MTTALPPQPEKNDPTQRHLPNRKLFRRVSQQFAVVCRWLHIYMSMFGFGTIVFFSVTGITLNHPDWFGLSTDRHRDFSGILPEQTFVTSDAQPEGIDRLAVAEFLRREHRLKGTVTDFRTDERECQVVWKGPAYSADVIIDRESRQYELSIAEFGIVPLMNDLHKGRDTGPVWSLLIDVSALLMTLSSITGFVLLLYIRRKVVPGLVSAFVGVLALFLIFFWYVP